jgi:predicted anti-sigma-YlaC factor YlaD
MALTSEQIGRLLKKIRQTREVEMTCPECLDELDKYTQRILDGEPIEGVLDRVREHLEDCPCCTNQYKLVLETLEAIEES